VFDGDVNDDGVGDGSVVNFGSGELATSVLRGFTITNGSSENGGGISVWGYSHPTLTNLTISDNEAFGNGGGVWIFYNSSANLTNVTISGNEADGYGGGIVCTYSSSANLTNVTVSGNTASNGSGGGLFTINSGVVLLNTILWNNSPQEIEFVEDGSVTVTYSDIQENEVWGGDGNINADPLFCNAADGDFTVRSDSPVLGTGQDGADMGESERTVKSPSAALQNNGSALMLPSPPQTSFS
jgi:hypothetical protein